MMNNEIIFIFEEVVAFWTAGCTLTDKELIFTCHHA